jgi:hypothetical protein
MDFFFFCFASRLAWLGVLLLGKFLGGLLVLHCLVGSFQSQRIYTMFFVFNAFNTLLLEFHESR